MPVSWAPKARGRGTRPLPGRKISGGRPPRNEEISKTFFPDNYLNFSFSIIFKIKWLKSEEKLNFDGMWVWVPISPFPQSNLRDEDLARHHLSAENGHS